MEAELALTATLRADNFAMLDGIESVTVLTGRAEFVDPHTVHGHPRRRRRHGRGVRRTHRRQHGVRPRHPDVPGLADSGVMATSTDLLATPELPRRLVVLGGGYVGLEFAAMYAAYGSEVTVLERHSEILGQEDDDVAACARDLLRENGVTVVTDAEVRDVEDGADAPATVYLPPRRRRSIGATPTSSSRPRAGGPSPTGCGWTRRASPDRRRRGGRRRAPAHQPASRLRHG